MLVFYTLMFIVLGINIFHTCLHWREYTGKSDLLSHKYVSPIVSLGWIAWVAILFTDPVRISFGRLRIPILLAGVVVMVFQDYVLFPHLNIFENVSFGLKMRGRFSIHLVEKIVEEKLQLLGIEDLKGRYPSTEWRTATKGCPCSCLSKRPKNSVVRLAA